MSKLYDQLASKGNGEYFPPELMPTMSVTYVVPRLRRLGDEGCGLQYFCESCKKWYYGRNAKGDICLFCGYEHEKNYDHKTSLFKNTAPMIALIRK